jgi:hypothetical protein
MRETISSLYTYCKNLLTEKRKELDAIALVLLDKETIDKDEFKEIVDKVNNGTFVFQSTKPNSSHVNGSSSNGSSEKVGQTVDTSEKS